MHMVWASLLQEWRDAQLNRGARGSRLPVNSSARPGQATTYDVCVSLVVRPLDAHPAPCPPCWELPVHGLEFGLGLARGGDSGPQSAPFRRT